MNTRIEIIDGREVMITICPTRPLPKKRTAGKLTRRDRVAKNKAIRHYRNKHAFHNSTVSLSETLPV